MFKSVKKSLLLSCTAALLMSVAACDLGRALSVAGWLVNPTFPEGFSDVDEESVWKEKCAELSAALEAPTPKGQREATSDEESTIREAYEICEEKGLI